MKATQLIIWWKTRDERIAILQNLAREYALSTQKKESSLVKELVTINSYKKWFLKWHKTEMMKHFLYSVAKEYDQGKKGPLAAAQVKLAIPKMATKIALDAIQLHGGYGYSREFPVERFLRDNKLNEIGAGTNEVMIMIIAKTLLGKE